MNVRKTKFSLKVKKSATGKGLFSLDKIPKGSYIIEYIGKDIPKEQQEIVSGKYMFATGRGLMIDGNIPENPARYINHSCRPNCEARGPRGHVYIYSSRSIQPGEELTYDYGKEYFNEYIKPFGCKCVKCKSKTV